MSNSNRPQTTNNSPASTGRTYWQSFEHLAESAEVREIIDKEFAGYDPEAMRSLSRRRFLKYVAASMALAGIGLAGCRRWPKEVLAPYAHNPTNRIPGVPEYYATSWELGGVGYGLLAESYDGRPIKIEGNPSHPGNVTRSGRWASADALAQAQPLSLYDPDRSRSVIDRTGSTPVRHDVEWFLQNVVPQLQQAEGRSMAVLCEATSSPTLMRLRDELTAAKAGVEWYTWEPLVGPDTAAATQAAYGRDLRPIYSLDSALVVVSLDDDYLGNAHPAHTRYAADWSVLRAAADPTPGTLAEGDHGTGVRMSRCYTAETRYTITGASGDIRLPIRPSRLRAIARAIAARVGVAGVQEPQLDASEVAFVESAVADLDAHRGQSLLAFGAHLPADVQQLAMAINATLGNVGQTIRYIDNPAPAGAPIETLVERMNAGEIGTLLILGGNPVYDAPADLAFADALARVPLSVHLSLYVDETSQLTTYHVPRAHFLEHWGDTRGWDGTIAPIQPLILPLFNGLSPIELIAHVAGLPTVDGYTLVRETFAGLTSGIAETPSPGAADEAFRKALHDGVLEGSGAEAVAVGNAAAPAAAASAELGAGQFELVFFGDSTIYDGRFANNGWLQELPEPLTKLTWDNAALVNINDAEELGVRTNDVIELSIHGRTLGIAVYVMPGQPRGVIGLPLGYGRTAGGTLAVVEPDTGGGFDTYRLRLRDGLFFASSATASRQGQQYLLAMTQNHHLIDNVGYEGREKRVGTKGEPGKIIRESTFAEHEYFFSQHHNGNGNGHGGGHHNSHPAHKDQHGAISLQIFNPPGEFNYEHAWGMTIDMTTCIGCSACVVACQSENNIPVVGKESVLNNREMHWLRVDRYFKSNGESIEDKKHDENPDVAWQPMMCVHCENAPCEQVCPVAATVHDSEGLNTMIYNRCIGTRYCSNNCPYKVRRFNYLDWHYKDPRGGTLSATFPGVPDQQQQQVDAIKRMVYNPEVTVRMRGVMEKCTYCTQRIEAQTIHRKNQFRAGEREISTIDDGDILTACQQACPTESIIFGNLNDNAARVTKQQQSPRAYGVLDELNTRPRTKHLARLRNRDEVRELDQDAPDEAHSEEPAHA